ncbi:MAG: quinone-dependent dihydroorotate dehydrogenase [Myxococcota bacterium]
MYELLRPLLFRLDPELAHRLALTGMRALGAVPPLCAALRALLHVPAEPVVAFGLRFPNPIGLAAGWDKDGLGIDGLGALGFGHVEVGTVTPRAQPGNPRPRVFRLAEDLALVNRMGFPSRGEDYLAARLARRRPSELVVGVNLGKNKSTPNELAAEDYGRLLERFAPLADYLVVNGSSPNTAGLRALQERSALEELLTALVRRRGAHGVPLLVKLAPDLDDAALDRALEATLAAGLDGVVATNTTLSRAGLSAGGRTVREPGGLSGAPLEARATTMVEKIVRRAGPRLPVIAAGGVMSAVDAQRKLDAGAVLVQVWTGFVYSGPMFGRQLLRGLRMGPVSRPVA